MARVGRIAWWQWLPRPWSKWRIVTRVDAGDEVPDRLPTRGVALVGSADKPTWIAFDCPCERGHRLMVSLDQTRRPAWRITSTKPLTVRPSVDDITAERRCHFFISSGKIKWSSDQGAST